MFDHTLLFPDCATRLSSTIYSLDTVSKCSQECWHPWAQLRQVSGGWIFGARDTQSPVLLSGIGQVSCSRTKVWQPGLNGSPLLRHDDGLYQELPAYMSSGWAAKGIEKWGFYQKIVEIIGECIQRVILSTKVNFSRGKKVRIRTYTQSLGRHQASPRKLKAVFSRNKIDKTLPKKTNTI